MITTSIIFSFILSFTCPHTDVLIIGDSQAGHSTVGGSFETAFEECGARVSRYSMPGWTNEMIFQFIQGERQHRWYPNYNEDYSEYEIVILIGGGNDIPRNQSDTVVEMIKYFQGETAPTILYSVHPPATRIRDLNVASRVFATDIQDPNHFTRGSYGRRRIEYRDLLVDRIRTETSAVALDIDEIYERIGEQYPDFTDGIHIPYSTSNRVIRCIFPFSDESC